MPRQQTPSTAKEHFAPLTDDLVRQQTDEGSFTRGRSYFRNGHIREPILRGDTIEALCIGSEPVPYRVTATLAPAGRSGESPSAISCTCPRGGFCKHIVALLLTWIDDPKKFRELAPIADQLADRSPEQLIDLIDRMVQRHPDLQSLIELPIPPSPTSSDDIAANAMIVDVSPVRRQVRSTLANYDPYANGYGWDSSSGWDGGFGVPNEIASFEFLAESYADAGQWANAQAVATALAEETLDVLPQLSDDNGDIGSIVMNADLVLARTLDAQADLPEDQRLSPVQREELIRTIYAIWQADIIIFGGIELSQHGTESIVNNVTHDERRMIESWLRQEDADGWSKRAVIEFIAALREVGGEGSDDDLLALYRDAELWDAVALAQIGMDRIDEAVATARHHLRLPHELTGFADALMRKREEHATRAIGLVDDLLWEIEGKNVGHDQQLNRWLQQQYGAHGREGDALKLAHSRFEKSPNVHLYREVEQVANLPGQPKDTWAELRPALIRKLESIDAWIDLIQVRLAGGEGMAALEALDTLERKRNASSSLSPAWRAGWDGGSLATQVAAAVERDAPDRAIAIYQNAAEREIAMKSRKNYQVAAAHLARVQAILKREGRPRDWRTFIQNLREEHKRLPALQDELDKRGLT